MAIKNIISFDIEEIFHGEYTRNLPRENFEYRTGKNINRIIELLDEYNIKATFFVVGELVEIFPDLLERIAKKGHEIGFHSYDHIPLWYKTPESLDQEIKLFKKELEKIGKKLIGFRAPSFSIDQSTRWAFDVLEKNEIVYDSSIFPGRTSLYGVKGAPNIPYTPSTDDLTIENPQGKIKEYPALVQKYGFFTLPTSGGFFLRLLPTFLFKKAIRSMNKRGYPAVLMIHNWELDNSNPVLNLSFKEKFIVYHNLQNTENKLRALLSSFDFTNFESSLEQN